MASSYGVEFITKRKRSRTFDADESDNCSVCLETLSESALQHLSCGHKVHASCWKDVRQHCGSRCPLCRKAQRIIVPEKVQTNSQRAFHENAGLIVCASFWFTLGASYSIWSQAGLAQFLLPEMYLWSSMPGTLASAAMTCVGYLWLGVCRLCLWGMVSVTYVFLLAIILAIAGSRRSVAQALPKYLVGFDILCLCWLLWREMGWWGLVLGPPLGTWLLSLGLPSAVLHSANCPS